MRTLAQQGGVATSEMESARQNESVAHKRTEHEAATLVKARVELEAAAAGLSLHQDAPYFLRRVEELSLKIPQMRGLLKENKELLDAVNAELAAEQRRVQLSAAVAAAPVGGVVWVAPWQCRSGRQAKRGRLRTRRYQHDVY